MIPTHCNADAAITFVGRKIEELRCVNCSHRSTVKIPQRPHGKINLFLAILLGLLLTHLQAGCQTTVKGGQNDHVTKGTDVAVTIPSGTTIKYHEDADHVSTTQPSYKGSAGQAFKIGEADEGQIGSISVVAEAKSNIRNVWWVGLIFLAAAAGLYYVGKPIAAIVAGACGLLTLLYPQVMIFVLLAILAYLAWGFIEKHRTEKRQKAELVNSVQAAAAVVPPDKIQQFKDKLASKQSTDTQKVVAAIKSGS